MSNDLLYPAIDTETYAVRLIKPTSENFTETEISMWESPGLYTEIVRELRESDEQDSEEMWEILWRNSAYFPFFFIFNIPPSVSILDGITFAMGSREPWLEMTLTGKGSTAAEAYHEALLRQFGSAYELVFQKPADLYPFLSGRRKRILLYKRMVRHINNILFDT